MSRSSAEKPAGESDHVECCTLAGCVCREQERLREAAGLVSGTSGCDQESFILSLGQSGRSPRSAAEWKRRLFLLSR